MEKQIEEMEEEKINMPEHKRSYWEFGLAVIIVIVLIAVVAVLAFLMVKSFSKQDDGKTSIQTIADGKIQDNSQNKKVENNVEISEKASEVKTPIVKEIIPTEVVIKVLNGGAVGGSASKVKEVLAAKGYKKVEAGNSEKSNYAGVTVFYQADMKTVAEKVVTDLKAKYPTAQAKAGTSVEEKSGPIIIILGK